jgi:predicted RNase H-like HicB family nuclease
MEIAIMAQYQAILEGCMQEGYSVRFPQFAGCVTAGDTVDEALFMAQEALTLHLQGLQEDGEEIEKPDFHPELAVRAGEILALVEVNIKPRKSRFNVMLDGGLVRSIDSLVQSGKYESRSAFLAVAAQHELSGRHVV